MSTAEAVSAMQQVDIPCAPLVGLDHLHLHPQVIANGILQEIDHPVLGRVRQAGAVATFSGSARVVGDPAAMLGSDSYAILESLGRSPDEIGLLEKKRIVGFASTAKANT
jgi:crotonobetainyl-CoA:carnitine CoA-transferase CaiB-like acyl-CoA transferase